MTPQDMAERRMQLLRKRWDATITSDEQDELDDITDALRLLYSSWEYRYRSVILEDVES